MNDIQEILENLLALQSLEFDNKTIDSQAEAAISKLRGKIPAPILEHYDRLGDHGKKGVAIVRNQVCTGCHVQLAIGFFARLKHGDDIAVCENCSRYLYLPREPEPEPVNRLTVARPRGRCKSANPRTTGPKPAWH